MKRPCRIEGCEGFSRKRGMCGRHYMRWYKRGTTDVPDGTRRGEPEAWLRRHLDYTGDDCLVWPFMRSHGGYARIRWQGKAKHASKVICEIVHGTPPTPAHQAAHSCGKGGDGCVNPRHLSWKSPAENIADKIAHGTRIPRRARNNASGEPGVCMDKRSGRWRAYTSHGNKYVHLGQFTTFEEAVAARRAAVGAP